MPHGIKVSTPLQPVFEKPAKAAPKKPARYDDSYERRGGTQRDWVYKEMRRRGTQHFGRGIVPPKPKEI